MKRLISLLLVLLISAMLVLTGCGGKQSNTQGGTEKPKEVYTLKYATWYPAEGHLMSGIVKEYIKNVEEKSGGRIKIQYYPAGQLAKVNETLEVCSKGAVDITGIVPTMVSGQVPLNTVTTLPFYSKAVEGTEIYEKLYATVPELGQELAKYNLRQLGTFTTSQYDVGTTKKQVKSPEDLKGIKLSTTGGYFNNIAAKYGILPISIGTGEMYEGLQKGIIEGTILSHSSTNGYKVFEQEKYLTNGLRMGAVTTIWVINEKAWQKLPADLQKILVDETKVYAKNAAAAWDKDSGALVEKFQNAGVTVNTIKPEDRAKWEAPLNGIEQDWIKDMNAKGLPGQKVCDEFIKIAEQVAK